jgi:hypothetical protein
LPQPREYSPRRHRGTEENKSKVKTGGHRGGGGHRGVKAPSIGVSAASVLANRRGLRRCWPLVVQGGVAANQKNIHHGGTEAQRKTKAKSKPEGTEVAEDTEGKGPEYRRLSGLGSRQSSRLAKMLAVSSTGRRCRKPKEYSPRRHRGKQKQSQNRRAQRWRRTQRVKTPSIGVSAASVLANRRGFLAEHLRKTAEGEMDVDGFSRGL